MKKAILLAIAVFSLALVLAACGSGNNAGVGDPAQVVQDYFTAKIQGDTIRRLLCSEMESVAEREVRSVSTV
ncbi:MAG: hypothetical protein R3C44_21850 [Chloroflexota bacterium]